jgi:hypothetical protein
MTGNINDLINYRISRAYETLKEAEKMIESEFWNASINRISVRFTRSSPTGKRSNGG